MSLNTEVILTCAVTGSADIVGKHPNFPITPQQIGEAVIEAAVAGASVAHIHTRDPETGEGNRDRDAFREIVNIVRDSGQDIVLNLTTGMGGTLIVGDTDPAKPGPGTDFVTPEERVLHVEELKPEICTLDCGTMNFGDVVAMNIPSHLAVMAERVRAAGVKPEIEVFDMGQIWLGKQLIADGVIDSPPMFQLCMGIPWGVESETRTMALMRDMLPDDAIWAGFGISRMAFPMVAQSMILGGHCRVGLEDNLYLEKGVYATNGQLVEKAIGIINALGGRVLSPQEARDKLGLVRRW